MCIEKFKRQNNRERLEELMDKTRFCIDWLAREHPKVLKRMREELNEWQDTKK